MTKFNLVIAIEGLPVVFRVLNHKSAADKIVVKVPKNLAMFDLVKTVLAEAGAASTASWEGANFFILEYTKEAFFPALAKVQELITQKALQAMLAEKQEASGLPAGVPLLLAPSGEC